MSKLKSYFSGIKWFEYVYMTFFYVVIISLGVSFHSSALIILNALLGVTFVFLLAKGMILGNIVALIQTPFYILISLENRYFGEVILVACVSAPIYILSIITWLKNMVKKENVVHVNDFLSLKEWIVSGFCIGCACVGIYFLLQYFNTANLVLSTIGVSFTTMAGYLVIRRSEFNFVFYILNNIITIALWTFVVFKDMSNLPTLINFVIYLILNAYGIYNWVMMKNKQREEIDLIKIIKES